MEATRTLVKSPPELWAELSDVAVLARHLGEFGAIRITRTEPETVVEWEAERASGSVRLEPSGWGTRVTLSTEPVAPQVEPAMASAPEPRLGLFARLFRRRPHQTTIEEAPGEARVPEPALEAPADEGRILDHALDSLGAAHHRPFSR